MVWVKKKEFEVPDHSGELVKVRSGLEKRVALQLNSHGICWTYESKAYKYYDKQPRAVCHACGTKGESYQERKYTPDFFLPNGVIYEVKGRFEGKDRKKMLAVKKEWPDIDIHMVFQRDNKLSKASSTKYSEWCEQKGFKWTLYPLPDEWIEELTNAESND